MFTCCPNILIFNFSLICLYICAYISSGRLALSVEIYSMCVSKEGPVSISCVYSWLWGIVLFKAAHLSQSHSIQPRVTACLFKMEACNRTIMPGLVCYTIVVSLFILYLSLSLSLLLFLFFPFDFLFLKGSQVLRGPFCFLQLFKEII